MLTQTIVIVFVSVGVALSAFAQTPSAMGTGLPLTALRPVKGVAAPVNLRCEHLADPLGIDETVPRLSWEMVDSRRGAVQRAYRILVADDAKLLSADTGNLWDTGKVTSDESVDVEYAGLPLRSQARAYWKVRVWGNDDRPSPWSQVARWTMGLLEQSDWQAKWIGYDKALVQDDPLPFEDAHWIWFAGDPDRNAPAGTRCFRASLVLPDDIEIVQAVIRITADDQFELTINGQPIGKSDGETDAWKRPVTADVAAVLQPGRNVLAVEAQNTAPGSAGLIAKLIVTPSEGEPVVFVSDTSWKCSDQPAGAWTQPAFDDRHWPAAASLGNFGVNPWGRLPSGELLLPPPRYFRKAFTAKGPVRRATVYGSALGLYELRINGRRVGDDYFTPGWTDYSKRIYYNTYDITDLICPGANALGAVLADGWYAGYVGFGQRRQHYGDKTRLRAQLRMEYADGTAETIATDKSWKAALGPLLEADFLMGETYDARREMPGWDAPGFDDAAWDPVDVTDKIAAKVEAYPVQPVRRIAELKPVEITEPTPGVYVLDLGQNFAGVARLKLTGKPGQKITLRFAERLNPDGTVYTTNLRSARATDTYYCRGDGREEIWQPRFTFHGFQHVEISGLTGKPDSDTVTGVALSSDTPVVGSFACSDEILNRLYRNICWTQRANFIDIPTDCPQRDERLGWTGDAQVFIRTATMNTDVQAFFTKWLVDLEDAQRADGQFPMVAPLKVAGGDGGPAWADAGVICPWTIYEVYGDRRLLEKHYDAMTRFIDFCASRSTDERLPPEKFHCFGDWLNINAETPKDVIYTAYFAHSTRLTARAAEALGKTEDAAAYHELFEQIKRAFNQAYVADDGRIKGDTQCGYVLALAFDLLDGPRQERAARYLIEDIERRGWHLSTGFVGTKDLMLVLAKLGRNDVAYRLLHNTTFPSWGFSIQHGATSIWERWNGWTPEEGFADPGMNSFAHYAFGAVGQWMFENIAGINTDGPGFQRIVIRPQPGGKLSWARASYHSIRGRIVSDWKIEAGRIALNVTVPANTTATVYVPTTDPASVTESGQPANQADGVEFLRTENGAVVYRVGSGQYRFAAAGP